MKITQDELLHEVLSYRGDGRLIVEPGDVPAGIPLPAGWDSVIANPFGMRPPPDLQAWDPVLRNAPNIAHFLESILLFNTVFWDEREAQLYLLYVYTEREKEIYFYAGRPAAAVIPEQVAPVLDHFPPELRHFYSRLHDGWTFLPSNAMGPLALRDCAFLSDDKFDFDDDKVGETPFDPKNVLSIFHNGAGDYLCLNFGDLESDGTAKAMIWWHEDPTRPEDVDFWPVLNAWMGIFWEDADRV